MGILPVGTVTWGACSIFLRLMKSLSLHANSTCDHLAVSAGTASCLTSSTTWKLLSMYNRDKFNTNPIFNLEITHDRLLKITARPSNFRELFRSMKNALPTAFQTHVQTYLKPTPSGQIPCNGCRSAKCKANGCLM